jgi:3-hydroxyacyl-[acyl-carrier-protein] dehydratase
MLDAKEIQEILPHRYPMLMIDRVLEIVGGEYSVALKNITVNEEVFEGHFPGNPVFPGIMIIEAMAQTAGVLAFKTLETKSKEHEVYMIVGIDKVRFRRPVVPGDQLMLRAEYVSSRRNIWKFKTEATVDGHPVASAEILCGHQKA